MISGLVRAKELNDTLVRVLGLRADGRVVGETKFSQPIAVPPDRVCILDFQEDVELIQRRGRRALRFAHPDKFGCTDSLRLLQMIIGAQS